MDAEEFLARLALGETVFEAAEVTVAVMVGVQLRRVSLRKAQIIRVDLRGADLTRGNLEEPVHRCQSAWCSSLRGQPCPGPSSRG